MSNEYDDLIEKRAKAAVFIPRFGRRSFESGLSNENEEGLLDDFNRNHENEFYLNPSNQLRFLKRNRDYFSSKRAGQFRIAFPRMG
jgi:hypothetical protein